MHSNHGRLRGGLFLYPECYHAFWHALDGRQAVEDVFIMFCYVVIVQQQVDCEFVSMLFHLICI